MKKLLTILLSNGQTVTVEVESEENVFVLDFQIEDVIEEEVTTEELDEIVEDYETYVEHVELSNHPYKGENGIDVHHNDPSIDRCYTSYSEQDMYTTLYTKAEELSKSEKEFEAMACYTKNSPFIKNIMLAYAKESYALLEADYNKLTNTTNNKYTKTRLFLRDEMNEVWQFCYECLGVRL